MFVVKVDRLLEFDDRGGENVELEAGKVCE
jgi:hypothetical protein